MGELSPAGPSARISSAGLASKPISRHRNQQAATHGVEGQTLGWVGGYFAVLPCLLNGGKGGVLQPFTRDNFTYTYKKIVGSHLCPLRVSKQLPCRGMSSECTSGAASQTSSASQHCLRMSQHRAGHRAGHRVGTLRCIRHNCCTCCVNCACRVSFLLCEATDTSAVRDNRHVFSGL